MDKCYLTLNSKNSITCSFGRKQETDGPVCHHLLNIITYYYKHELGGRIFCNLGNYYWFIVAHLFIVKANFVYAFYDNHVGYFVY